MQHVNHRASDTVPAQAARIDELLSANVRFEKRARDAEAAVKALQVTADEAIKAAYAANTEAASRVPSKGAQDVLAERGKHPSDGFTPEHDDKHKTGELPRAAVVYALDAVGKTADPWPAAFAKAVEPWLIMFARTPRTNLVYAAALLLAELDRLDRAEAKKVTP